MFLYHSPPARDRETRCHLCLRDSELSFEHIPPHAAYNGARLWERLNPRSKGVDEDGNLKGALQTLWSKWQAGFKVRTLCAACNNRTGSTSAASYVRFVKSLAEAPRLFEARQGQRVINVREDTRMIARQIAVMILAIEDARFAEVQNDLRLFARGELDAVTPPFRVLAFLVPDSPHAGTIARSHARLDAYAPGCGAMAGEISLFPFGFVYAYQLQRAYRPEELADITQWFSETHATARRNAWVSLPTTITVLDSMHCTLGNPRFGPQIDTVPEY
jgi:hypothetical protein